MAPKDNNNPDISPAEKLRRLKDRKVLLQRKLQALEEKQKATQDWFEKNRRSIVEDYYTLHQRLSQSLAEGSFSSFLNFVHVMKPSDYVGTALNIPYKDRKRFYDYIAENGKDCALYKETLQALESVDLGLPADAFKDIDMETQADIEAAQKSHQQEAEQKATWWKRAISLDTVDKALEINNVKKELLEIERAPSYKKSVITGFFDWAEAATEQPEDYQKDGHLDIDHLQNQHEDTEFVIRTAQHDLNEMLSAFGQQIYGLARHYTRLKDFIEDPEKHDAKDLKSIVRNTFYAENSAAILGKVPMRPDNGLASHLAREVENKTLFFEYLDLIVQYTDESPAEDKRTVFFYPLLEAIVDKKTTDPVFALRVTLDAMLKAGEPLGQTFEDTSALWRIARSELDTDSKKQMTAMLLQEASVRSYSEADLERFQSIYDMVQWGQHGEADKFVPNKDYTHNLINSETYAFLNMIAPDLNLYQTCFEEKSAVGPDFFYNLLKSGIPFDMGNTEKYEAPDILAKVYQNILDDASWTYSAMVFYDWMENHYQAPETTTDKIKCVLIQPVDNGPERYIDKLVSSGNTTLIAHILDFMKTPVEKANFLHDMAENAVGDELKKLYQDITAVIDTPLMEYRNGEAFAASKAAFVTARHNQIIYQIEDTAQVLPGQFSDAEMHEVFYGLLRYGFIDVGGQLVNPDNISFAKVTGTDENPALVLYPNSLYAQLGIEGESTDSALQKLVDANPQLVCLGNNLVNPEKIDHVYFEGDCVNFVCDDTTVLSLECEDTAKNDIKKILSSNGTFTEVNDHFINTDRAEAIVYFEDTEQFVILNGNATYTAGEKLKDFNESYLREEIPDIKCSPAEARVLLSKLESRDYVIEGNTAIRTTAVCEISKTPGDGDEKPSLALLLSRQNRCFDYLTEAQQEALAKKIRATRPFIPLGNAEIALDQIRKIDLDPENSQMIVGNTVYSIEQAKTAERAKLKKAFEQNPGSDLVGNAIVNRSLLDAAYLREFGQSLSLVYGGIEGYTKPSNAAKALQEMRYADQNQKDNLPYRIGTGISEKATRRPNYFTRSWQDLKAKQKKRTQKPEEILYGENYKTQEPARFARRTSPYKAEKYFNAKPLNKSTSSGKYYKLEENQQKKGGPKPF